MASLHFSAASGRCSVFQRSNFGFNGRTQTLFHDTLDMSLHRTCFLANAANQCQGHICQAISLPCTTHVKSLSRHKVCCVLISRAKTKFERCGAKYRPLNSVICRNCWNTHNHLVFLQFHDSQYIRVFLHSL